jgi:hypothetical protein
MRKRLILICLAGLLAGSCFGPVRHYLDQSPDKKKTADTSISADSGSGAVASKAIDTVNRPSSAKTTAQETAVLPPAPDFIEIEAWPGKWFVVLEKPAIYCKYGYDLYTCPRIDSCRGPVDSAMISKYHRARCDKFAGCRLKALSVTPRGNEWTVSFEEEKSGMKLYARTVKGVFGDIALESDLDGAKKRWIGKKVYSARGFLTAFDNGKALGIKVRLQDSLKVYDVRFGLAPLPTKPVWLMVETARGEKGTIPVYYSWTNVKKELRRTGNPWDDDVFEISPERTYTIDAPTWDIINSHTVRVGMTRDAVRLAWGFPLSVKTEPVDGKQRECWVYQAQRVCFDEKEVVLVKENQ